MARRACICLLLCWLPLAGAGAAESDEEAIEILQSLARQAREIETLRAEFTINASYKGSDQRTRTRIQYIRSGEKFSVAETRLKMISRGPVFVKRAYNGKHLKSFFEDEGPRAPFASIERTDNPEFWESPNNPLKLCGFDWPDFTSQANRADRVFRLLGTDQVDGRQCTKVLAVGPYTPSSKAYVYYWIADDAEGLRLIKSLCLVDDNPEKKLYERRFEYDLSGEVSFPTKLRYERRPDGSGAAGFESPFTEHIREVVFESVEINGPVSDDEFEFAFPNGTRVYDSDAGVSYVISSGADELEAEILPETLALEEAEIEVEEPAVKSPPTSSRTPPEEVSPDEDALAGEANETDGGAIREIVGLAVLCLLAAGAAAAILVRKRGKKAG